MIGLADPATGAAGAVAIILLVVLLAEHEILRMAPSPLTRSRKRALLVLIVPLLMVFVLVGVLRLDHLAATHP
jgi:hypothetical protein